ncbi:MAG: BACON domain-containing protein [Bacteroidales bacterium]|jgi:hypothetical protein|nr:BACON domain-containing protein [Bacteroidales bacterium]
MKKTTFKIITILMILAGGMASCNDKPNNLTVSETFVATTAESGTYSVVVHSNGEWFAVVEDATNHTWCILNNATGTNGDILTINVSKNPLPIARNATVNITSGNSTKSVSINQEATKELPEGIVEPIQPSEEVMGFFAWPYILGYDTFFVGGWSPFEIAIDTCVIINSMDELRNIYSSSYPIPMIDFDLYTLIIGHSEEFPSTAYSLVVRNLINEPETLELNLQIICLDAGYTVFASIFYWRLYPKLPSKPLNVSITWEGIGL